MEAARHLADNQADAALSLSGADAKYFDIDADGTLTIDQTVDGTVTDYDAEL